MVPVSKPRVWRSRGVLAEMVLRDFQSKYVGSLLGLFWTVINPLLLLMIFTFVFTVVFRAKFGAEAGLGTNALYILAGILPWVAFQEGLGRATGVLLEHRNLVTRVQFPVLVLPAVPVLSAILGQLIGLVVLLILAAIFAPGPGLGLAWLPVLIFFQALFTLGLAWIVAGLNVFYRDVVHLVAVLLLVWMYGTPIFYPAAMVPERYRFLIALNPMAHLIEAYRRVILEGAQPSLGGLAILGGCAALSLGLGFGLYRRWSLDFADRL
jgi:ABC-type polysaccharide/polyol phosphate export permease